MITKDDLVFYEPLSIAIQKYITQSERSIQIAEMLGQDIVMNTRSSIAEMQTMGASKEEIDAFKRELNQRMGAKIKNTLTYDILQMMNRGELTPQKEEIINKMLFSLYNPSPTNKFVKAYGKLQTLFLLGKFENAVTQITEIKSSLIENGLASTIQALFKIIPEILKTKVFKKPQSKDFLTLSDVGIGGYQEDYKNEVMKGVHDLSNLVDITLKLNGFKLGDMTPKLIFTNSKYIDSKNRINRKDKEIFRQLQEVFGEDAGQVADDIKNGNITENVQFFIYTRMSEWQPLDLLELPEAYLKGGNISRLMYKFKTYGLKQFSKVRKDGFGEMYKGIKYRDEKRFLKGLWFLLRWTAYTAVMIELKNRVQEALHDKKHDSMNTIYGILAEAQPFFNRYSLSLMPREGLTYGIVKGLVPPLAPVEYIFSDVLDLMMGNNFKFKTIQYSPLFGGMLYNNVFGGLSSTSSNKYVKPKSKKSKEVKRSK